MRTAVYFCSCGTNISEKIDPERIARELGGEPTVAYVRNVEYLCSEEGKEFLEADLRENRPDRAIVAACSPRDYESAFMQCLGRAGMNPYFLQMVNIREQVAWVTPDPCQAAEKACRMIRAAVARVQLHAPLERTELDVCTDVVVIGAGPAGLKAALALAEGGRKVTVVEKTPVLGGMPMRYGDLFPNLECSPCLLEPVLAEVMHGPHAERIELLTLSEVVEVTGYYGNFTVKVQQTPRYVDVDRCIGCGYCIPPCPATTPNEFNYGLDERKAISYPFSGVLPNAPFLDLQACLRGRGEDCRLCQAACPVEGAVCFNDREKTLERQAGALVVAIGAGLYDCGALPSLGHGRIPGVYTSLEFERILADNGPTHGQVSISGGTPQSVAIMHCAGSLDPHHRPYCSGICCQYAFKFNHLLESKRPGARVLHLYKELVMPGKEAYALYQRARDNPHATFVRYGDIGDVEVSADNGQILIRYPSDSGRAAAAVDMLVLCPPVVPNEGASRLAALLDAPCDEFGFFEELNGRLAFAESKMKGIYLAGACQSPTDVQRAAGQGMAAAAGILAGLVPGRKLQVEPITAWTDEEKCSGCRLCAAVCPYKAIGFEPQRRASKVNPLLCHGCGTCVATCPAGAMQGNHFSNAQIFAEIEAILQ